MAVLEFVPNEDRVSPRMAAGFSLVMLATTSAGDAYTFRELEAMLHKAGLEGPAYSSDGAGAGQMKRAKAWLAADEHR